ncbi:hypothetical protein GCM10009677_25110 [Sphaerisporangium rubeum]|uniref:UDP-3-O-[3-hydroxymyristoyl] glucosamine N-acyltransferase n=1 Tax=Sphaerisporangium rubeum TaxID=321317 RepID=A0A7X0IC30_9ACTN|nr:hypothetical protein [Sphaerisporangium rubeum]MBB6471223.1 UDP-3-O-[3-hydroxymyristoyl] glucosamine N-acyltransferase [Sphaerisporangium rubeum]
MSTGLVVIGAGTFAVEVTRYLDDLVAAGHDSCRVAGHLAVADEPVHVPAAALEKSAPEPGTRVVLAVADPVRRRELIDGLITERGLDAVDVVHPAARVDPAQLLGPGNIIGPDSYIGAEAVLGGFNVVHYHCSIGHHSRAGSNNFFAPNFHCGAGVRIGDDNFFGLSCTVAPGVDTGSRNRFQAGITLFEDAPSGHSYLVPSRIKSIKTS